MLQEMYYPEEIHYPETEEEGDPTERYLAGLSDQSHYHAYRQIREEEQAAKRRRDRVELGTLIIFGGMWVIYGLLIAVAVVGFLIHFVWGLL
jgi:hypothetical protein